MSERTSSARSPTVPEAATEALHTLEALWEAFMADRMPPMERWNNAMKGLRSALRDAKGREG